MHRRGSKHDIDRHEYLACATLYCKRGTELPQSKLTPNTVREISQRHRPGDPQHGQHALARHYNVHQRTIEKIVAYTTWRHVL